MGYSHHNHQISKLFDKKLQNSILGHFFAASPNLATKFAKFVLIEIYNKCCLSPNEGQMSSYNKSFFIFFLIFFLLLVKVHILYTMYIVSDMFKILH